MNNKPLLTVNNTKTIKGELLGYKTLILYLLSYKQNSKRINLCSHASKGCAASCLVGSGHGSMSTVFKGRQRKTELFLSDSEGFIRLLDKEIEYNLKKNAGKFTTVIRLNGTTDISWEKYRIFDGKNIFEKWGDIQFYDYTKNHLRFDRPLPSNYHLTFSRSETNHEKAMELLGRGINVAMVFDSVPSEYCGYKVINGDESDLRFLDERGVIVGLKYKKMTGKGGAEKNIEALKNGFVIINEVKK
jgi:hypothetical protein